jgi:hypothetical protein
VVGSTVPGAVVRPPRRSLVGAAPVRSSGPLVRPPAWSSLGRADPPAPDRVGVGDDDRLGVAAAGALVRTAPWSSKLIRSALLGTLTGMFWLKEGFPRSPATAGIAATTIATAVTA